MRGSGLVIFIVSICVIAILGMLGYIFFNGSSSQKNISNSSTSVTPSVQIKDFAPGLPMNQKTTILIQTSDSSDIKYIVPTNQVNIYIKSLPEGYRVISKTP